MWIVIAVVAVVVLGLAAWWLLRDPDADLRENFEVERKWAWELELTEEQETALMKGLREYDDLDGGPMSLHGMEGTLSLFSPRIVVSLYLLGRRFAAAGPATLSNPYRVVRSLLSEFIEKEQPGVLHLPDDYGWFPDEVGGMDHSAFADAVLDILTNAHDRRVTGGSWDGDAQVKADVREAGPEGRPDLSEAIANAKLAGADDESAFDQAWSQYEGERSRQTNSLVLNLARVLEQYVAAKQSQPKAGSEELLRGIVARMLASESPGVLWVRPATDGERRILADAASNSGA